MIPDLALFITKWLSFVSIALPPDRYAIIHTWRSLVDWLALALVGKVDFNWYTISLLTPHRIDNKTSSVKLIDSISNMYKQEDRRETNGYATYYRNQVQSKVLIATRSHVNTCVDWMSSNTNPLGRQGPVPIFIMLHPAITQANTHLLIRSSYFVYFELVTK